MKAVLFLLIGLTSSLGAQKLPIYTSDSGGFKVFQPGEWQEKWQKLPTNMGELEVFSLVYAPADSLGDPNALYLLNYLDYPEEILMDSDNSLIQSLFEESLNSTLENLDGRLLYSEPINLYEYAGRLSRIEYDEGEGVVKSKMFIVNQRFYYLQVYTSGNRGLNKKMDQFLNSFDLLFEE